MKFLHDPKFKFLISLFMGLLTAVGFFWALENHRREDSSFAAISSVLRAKRYIKAGRVLTKDLVEETELPSAYAEPLVLKKKEDLYDGQGAPRFKAKTGLLKGEQIMASKLVDDKLILGLSGVLEPGLTAVTFRLGPEEAVGGWVRPGDWVQVFCTLDKQPQVDEAKVSLLFSRVMVLAVDDKKWDSSAPLAIDKNTDDPNRDLWNVTLALNSRQAALAFLGQKKGNLSLALLSTLNQNSGDGFSVSLNNLK